MEGQTPNECGHFHTAMGRLLAMPAEATLAVHLVPGPEPENPKADVDDISQSRIPYAELKAKLRKQFHVTGVCNWEARAVDWEHVRDLAELHLPKAKRLRVGQ